MYLFFLSFNRHISISFTTMIVFHPAVDFSAESWFCDKNKRNFTFTFCVCYLHDDIRNVIQLFSIFSFCDLIRAALPFLISQSFVDWTFRFKKQCFCTSQTHVKSKKKKGFNLPIFNLYLK